MAGDTLTSPPLTPIIPKSGEGGEDGRDFRYEPSIEELGSMAAQEALENMGVVPPKDSYLGLLVLQKVIHESSVYIDIENDGRLTTVYYLN